MIRYDPKAPDFENKSAVQPYIKQYIAEVGALLPELREDIWVYLDNSFLIKETGTGGFAYAPDTMTISFDKNFKDRQVQLMDLRGTIFHEGYHLVQGHTYEAPNAKYKTALDNAIYEGCATVFEREYADVSPPWGDYSEVPTKTLEGWQNTLANMAIEDYRQDQKTWQRWAFGDETTNGRWPTYRVGTKLVDDYLAKTGKNIIDLRTMQSEEIITDL